MYIINNNKYLKELLKIDGLYIIVDFSDYCSDLDEFCEIENLCKSRISLAQINKENINTILAITYYPKDDFSYTYYIFKYMNSLYIVDPNICSYRFIDIYNEDKYKQFANFLSYTVTKETTLHVILKEFNADNFIATDFYYGNKLNIEELS